MKESREFQLRFQNISIVNLRLDFRNFKDYVDEVVFEEASYNISSSSYWQSNKFEIEEEFNKIMRLSIMGIECYVKAAVQDKLHSEKLLNKTKEDHLKNPFKMSRKVYEVYYHCLPALIDESLSLKKENKIWEKTKFLYEEVRNPIFHGYEAVDINPVAIGKFFDQIQNMYNWIDSWYELDF